MIVEPFCGAANYAYIYFDRDVILCDRYIDIIKIWRWIQAASRSDILALPEPKYRDRISDIKGLSEGEELLLRICAANGNATTQYDKVSRWAGGIRKAPRPGDKQTKDKTVFQRLKKRLLRIAGRIGHWKIYCMDYRKLENREATWFIDPPYQYRGKSYIYNNSQINYKKLGKWSENRKGQIIVCEAYPASWLPFVPLQYRKKQVSNTKHTYEEVIYHRSDKKIGLENLL